MLTPGVRFLLALGTAAFLSAQQIPDARITQMPEVSSAHATGFDRFTKPYRAPVVSLVDFRNSNRIYSLIRGGQLYLTLQDAIALALENSLDVELQRFGLRIAESDLLRARGGGQPRPNLVRAPHELGGRSFEASGDRSSLECDRVAGASPGSWACCTTTATVLLRGNPRIRSRCSTRPLTQCRL